ncbi:MAG: F0F1 ATP synthase subunit delta [Lawsonella sp.]|jgi:F-type H+-transporting ATPase subunit delta|uniref:F0F1 ATP synthase subunit delta n=1 Tax=Lawsonella sp. TaxID=2041415 RepID=UPI0025D6742C|nr:F0F1 ATP synthase subunit delta [Lawsonella sp.]MDY2979048.1 F0F1 ATP synthase subunit delta [Lawsonella sp.]
MSVMYAASRDALATIRSLAEQLIRESEQSVVVGQQMGAELFTIVELVEADRPTRVALADVSASPEQRKALMTRLIEGKVLPETLRVCQEAAARDWSNPADLRDGLVRTARSALLQAAELSNSLPQVEEELFRLSRTIKAHPGLEQALGDRQASADERRALLAQMLYGKVSAISEILASQAVARPQEGLVADDLDILSRQAAHETGRRVADVTTPVALTDAQREGLQAKLRDIYGIEVSIHEVVDRNIIGGVIIKVGNEIINGSLASKLESLRRSLV